MHYPSECCDDRLNPADRGRTPDAHAAEQIGVDLVPRRRLRGFGPPLPCPASYLGHHRARSKRLFDNAGLLVERPTRLVGNHPPFPGEEFDEVAGLHPPRLPPLVREVIIALF